MCTLGKRFCANLEQYTYIYVVPAHEPQVYTFMKEVMS